MCSQIGCLLLLRPHVSVCYVSASKQTAVILWSAHVITTAWLAGSRLCILGRHATTCTSPASLVVVLHLTTRVRPAVLTFNPAHTNDQAPCSAMQCLPLLHLLSPVFKHIHRFSCWHKLVAI